MEPSEAEKLKGRRAQLLLYVLMFVMIVLPVIAFFVRSH